MIKHLKLLITALAVVSLTFSACKKENPDTGVKSLSFELRSQTSLSSFLTFATPAISWNYAVLNANNFSYMLKDEGNSVHTGGMQGLWNFDMLANNDAFLNITFPQMIDFDEINAEINMKASESKPPLILKAVVSGLSGTPTPVEFYFTDDATLTVNVKNLDKLTKSNYTAVITFEANKLMAAVDYSKLASAVKKDGKIIISNNSNITLYNQAKAALNSSYSITLE